MSFKHQSPPLSFSSSSSLAPTIVYSTPFTEGVITFPSVDVIYLKLQSRVLEKKGFERSLQAKPPCQSILFQIFFSFSFSILLIFPRPSIFLLQIFSSLFLLPAGQIFSFSKYFPSFPSLFSFSSMGQIFSFSKYCPPLPSPWRGVQFEEANLSFIFYFWPAREELTTHVQGVLMVSSKSVLSMQKVNLELFFMRRIYPNWPSLDNDDTLPSWWSPRNLGCAIMSVWGKWSDFISSPLPGE